MIRSRLASDVVLDIDRERTRELIGVEPNVDFNGVLPERGLPRHE